MTPAAERPKRQRVFLDANVLFSAAYRADSGLAKLWQVQKRVQLISAPYTVEEARRNLDELAQRERLAGLLAGVEIVADVTTGVLPNGLVLPPKDRPAFLAALAAGSTHFLTGDRVHFGDFFGRVYGSVLIERPGDYLRRERRW